jgi:hypothetical protein
METVISLNDVQFDLLKEDFSICGPVILINPKVLINCNLVNYKNTF